MPTPLLPDPLDRRDFLKTASFATMMSMLGAIPIQAAEESPAQPVNRAIEAPLNFGVIGCGRWGREILQTLGRRPNAPVLAVCDTYKPYLTRVRDMAPKAEHYTDYQELLGRKEVQAVVIATPSHQHKEIVLAALAAGKHVYCEAPLASNMEDARAIAAAAKAHPKLNFQAGLQYRSDPQLWHLGNFVRTGVLGRMLKIRSQLHKKQSWRVTSPNPDREQEINWRLDQARSPGLVGELGLHQLDLGCWYLGTLPEAVSGYGALMHWTDGRTTPDTVHACLEFPNEVLLTHDCTLASSFEAETDVIYGSDSAVLLRDRQAWLFKEADAPELGWEINAKREKFHNESGIILGADATKVAKAPDGTQAAPAPPPETSLSYALQRFLTNSLNLLGGVEDFLAGFPKADAKGLQAYLDTLNAAKLPAAGWKEGYQTTVLALKANEAVLRRERIVLSREWFAVS